MPLVKGVVRRYYIGVIEIDWDYCPEKIDPVNGESLLNPNTLVNLKISLSLPVYNHNLMLKQCFVVLK